MKKIWYLTLLSCSFIFADNTEIEQILVENNENIALSEESQENVDNLSSEKDSLLAEWKVVVKQVEGLKIYNEQKRDYVVDF